ncbi:MAG: CHAT domain-containing tetratricopeptide repeat protein [Pirellulaceae bacterium]|nr:CHAT domain-containing tetratricopeptide repeat protein [Pirellulaceae bacterium]
MQTNIAKFGRLLILPWLLCNPHLFGQTEQGIQSPTDITAIRTMFQTQKAEYQSELIEHGLNDESQLIRLANLVLLSTALQDFDACRLYLDRARIHCEAIYGNQSPQTWDAQLAFNASSNLQSLSPEKKDPLASASQIYLQVDTAIANHQPQKAIELVKLALELRTKALDANHPELLKTMLDVAHLLESLREGPMEMSRRQQVWNTIFDDQPDYLFVLRGFSSLLYRQTDHAGVEQILRKLQHLLKSLHFEKSEMYAIVLLELGTLAYMHGDFLTAKDLVIESLDVNKGLGVVSGENAATNYQTLALILLELGELEASKKYFEVSLSLDEQAIGREKAEFWVAKIRFAWLLYKSGEYDQAHETAKEALRKLNELGAATSSNQALAFTVIGKSAQGMNDFQEAEEQFRLALQLSTEPNYDNPLEKYQGVLLNNLAKCLQANRAFEEASRLYERAIIKTREALNRSSAIQSERQQIALSTSLKYQLDNYVSCLVDAGSDRTDAMVNKAYQQVFGWKGSVLVRQRQIRQLVDSEDGADFFEQLQKATIKLSKLSNSVPEDPASIESWKKDVQQANEEKESIQREMTRLVSQRMDHDQKSMSFQRFQASLPKNAVMVDYLIIRSTTSRLIAFVVAPQDSARILDLGPTEPIEAAIEEWRSDIQARALVSSAALQLKSLIWEPLEVFLPDKSTVLISTDGLLGRIPFAAFPGRDRDRYLIEERKIAMLPVPQLLPAILEKSLATEGERTLLTLGDVEYESKSAEPVEASPISEKRATTNRVLGTRRFGPLQETAREIDRIEELFNDAFRPDKGAVQRLTKANASEAAFRQSAPGFTHVHLATHGFFADARIMNAESTVASAAELPMLSRNWRGVPAGLQSGLAMSGANAPGRESDVDDGILTADEISTMPLEKVELIVLSACETGLGKSAAGEGTLGLQRAFQVSGARSTITSLWNVSDLGTRLLMDRFYENLWQRKLDKLEAFRDAQLYMLGKSQRDPTAEQLRAAIVDLPQAIVRPANSNTSNAAVNDFNHPFYWAAFSLSGDWR